jgi:hypothetical protein
MAVYSTVENFNIFKDHALVGLEPRDISLAMAMIHSLLQQEIEPRTSCHLSCKKRMSRYRPGVTQRVPGGFGSQIFMTFGI